MEKLNDDQKDVLTHIENHLTLPLTSPSPLQSQNISLLTMIPLKTFHSFHLKSFFLIVTVYEKGEKHTSSIEAVLLNHNELIRKKEI